MFILEFVFLIFLLWLAYLILVVFFRYTLMLIGACAAYVGIYAVGGLQAVAIVSVGVLAGCLTAVDWPPLEVLVKDWVIPLFKVFVICPLMIVGVRFFFYWAGKATGKF
jgi:hypothetical protein